LDGDGILKISVDIRTPPQRHYTVTERNDKNNIASLIFGVFHFWVDIHLKMECVKYRRCDVLLVVAFCGAVFFHGEVLALDQGRITKSTSEKWLNVIFPK
jgi:hypothetical protein